MKIGMQTWGSNGDIRPLMALAEGLAHKGHTVTFIASSLDNRSYASEFAKLNIAYQQIPEHIDFDLESFATKSFNMNTAQWLVALLEACFFPFETDIYEAAKQLVSDNDLVIGHHFLYPLKLAAQKQGKPFISVTFCHAMIEDSKPPFRFPDLGRTLNAAQWWLMNTGMDWLLKKRLGRLWLEEGMPTFKHVYAGLLSSDLLNLIAVDPFLCPNHAEWQAPNKVCGFLNLSGEADPWLPSAGLQAFLEAGEKPVYMTFGSLQQAVPDWSMDLFIEAVHLSGCRAIIQTSSEDYPAETQLKNIFFIGRHPHQPLFQHCAAVVHHGGAGTTHSATVSGCPSIVVPFMDEQLFWALQLQRCGLAPAPLHAKHADSAQLAGRIQTTLASSHMAHCAQLAKHTVSGTEGVPTAIALIEECLQHQDS